MRNTNRAHVESIALKPNEPKPNLNTGSSKVVIAAIIQNNSITSDEMMGLVEACSSKSAFSDAQLSKILDLAVKMAIEEWTGPGTTEKSSIG